MATKPMTMPERLVKIRKVMMEKRSLAVTNQVRYRPVKDAAWQLAQGHFDGAALGHGDSA